MNRTELMSIVYTCYKNGIIDKNAMFAILHEHDCRTLRSNFPETYAEIDYGERNDAEAIDGMRFDDMNYMRYRER